MSLALEFETFSRGTESVTSDQKQYWMRVRLLAVARLFVKSIVASIVTASFLITVAPLGSASFAASETLDCCVGKPGHEPGSCASGLKVSLAVSAGVGEAENCHTENGEPAQPSAPSQSAEIDLYAIHAASKPCSEHCSACSTSVTRRPREHSVLLLAARPQITPLNAFSSSNELQVRPLNQKWSHLRPRAPPILAL